MTKEIPLHPLCTLFPRMDGEAFATLVADINANGQREPITLVDGMILDGGNRYRACIAAGREPQFVPFTGSNIVAFVLSANLHRRHMTPGQQAAVVSSAQNWASAHAPHREKGATLHPSTVSDRAAQSGASRRTQQMADKVARKSPELAKQVAHGEISLPEAVKQVAPAKPSKPSKHVEKTEPEHDGPSFEELVNELQAENTRLVALLKASEADDLKAEAIKWRAAYDRALVSQSEAMDAAARSEKREKFTMRQLMRCGKAVGETDIRNIPAKVEALARHKVAA